MRPLVYTTRMSSAVPIQTVIFDLSEVLLTGLKGTEHALASIIAADPQTIHAAFHGPHIERYFTGHIFEDEYWRAVDRIGNWNLPLEVYRRLVRQNFREIEGVRPAIIDLRRRGKRIGLLSNHGKEWVRDIEQRFDLESLFGDRVYSCDVGVSKPSRAIYDLALRRLRADSETTLVIDDHIPNLLAAREVGCHVLQFMSAHQLEHDLKARIAE